jgi:hypothetical protein
VLEHVCDLSLDECALGDQKSVLLRFQPQHLQSKVCQMIAREMNPRGSSQSWRDARAVRQALHKSSWQLPYRCLRLIE